MMQHYISERITFQLQLSSDKNSAEGLSLREQTAQHFEMQLFQISIDRTSNVLRSPAEKKKLTFRVLALRQSQSL